MSDVASDTRRKVTEALAQALVAQGWPDQRILATPDSFPISEGDIDLAHLATDAMAVVLEQVRRGSPESSVPRSPQSSGGCAAPK